MPTVPDDLQQRLQQHGQEHVLRRLGPPDRRRAPRAARPAAGARPGPAGTGSTPSATTPSRCRRRTRIEPVPVVPADVAGQPALPAARRGGAAARRGGGAARRRRAGQPARLRASQGHVPRRPGPNKTLFQIHAEKVLALRRRYGKPLPFLVMTSPATDAETRDVLRRTQLFRPAGGRGASSSARGRCRPSTWRRASCCWRRPAGCSSAPTATAAR